MTSPQTPSTDSTTSCWSCQTRFDALTSAWCSCLVSARTFVCPACLQCFCRAPNRIKLEFWNRAPESVWVRKTEPDATGMPTSAVETAKSQLRRPLVLVVDDDRAIQRLARHVLDSLGFGTLSASNGLEGLELAQKHHPDLVLADALMPKLDGREMCLKLKEDPATASIRTVIMTAVYKSQRAKTEAISQYRVDDYVSKPIAISELQAVLRRLLA